MTSKSNLFSHKMPSVFYLNPIEKYQQEEHSYPLVPGLTPIIYVQNEEQNFLGKPYTECVNRPDYSG